MKVPVKWNDSIFVWAGPEDFIWSDAYRIVNEVIGTIGEWTLPRTWEQTRKKLPSKLAEEFLEVIVKVNGLTHTYKKSKGEKPKITVDHIQRTFREFQNPVKVKAEIKKT
jgi:hypothetical protein